MTTEVRSATGVDQLIEQLVEKGVQRGKEKEQEAVKRAKETADKLVSDAKADAEAILAKAKKEVEELENSGKSALEVAARDAMLEVEQKLQKQFAAIGKRAMSGALADEQLLKSLILTVAGNVGKDIALEDKEKCEILLPNTVGKDDADLQKFVNGFSKGMLKEGVEIKTCSAVKQGICVKLVDRDLEVDLSDKAISDYVLQYLRPRFRAVLEGEK